MSDDLAAEVRQGLSAKRRWLPPVVFYDAAGSALFEEITRTPEYYPTRTELGILEAKSHEILELASGKGPLAIVELGAGSGAKTRTLLKALLARQDRAEYVPIDVSPDALVQARDALAREMPEVVVRPLVGRNRAMLRELDRDGEPPHLVLFIGSSIGNFDREDAARFLSEVAATLRPQDSLLLGTDMVKDQATLERAYNDAAGVTARFDLNALARLNREMGADFDLSQWRHRAHYDAAKQRVEMHLESLRDQVVRIPKLDLTLAFAKGETIHTENSAKYTLPDIQRMAQEAGLRIERTWSDEKGWFTLHLLKGVGE